MKKILMMAVALVMAVSANAQNPEKGLSWGVETAIGTEWELGVRAQYNFNQYFAWDVLNVKYAYDWDRTKIWGTTFKTHWNEIAITTGVRGFSPTFFNDRMKAFANFDLGYGAMFNNGNTNCFAIDFGVGLYVWKGLYAGYALEALCKNGSHTDHLLRIGYNFTF
ncbi:MAG: hypothetical protein IJT19_01010 [Bacteroidaceae bacterium]|nr:hypothetical protein [Bacteroidaceae bacterium]